mmetsp:Transcript_7791/g.15461  ORF Transcript_7791/g.15461 Transcript_7791/m.15461 type:complete len:429 (+) Transcript_7791:209-1495(+)|eukprot:CAMPEP_0171495482 /NCGR_PEP_ID=MMETSP0958-20121227/6169_1 /TAXON_ID=87120 /ORGANISM="Aurantiochytrium limacinum, Strain ATCCMYA-1381" /LENGTH=428 /DNA_ID=CAMNT_0012029475 /DNA_START=229 /DNA_END=1515 /DNA_ORIENTATION=+
MKRQAEGQVQMLPTQESMGLKRTKFDVENSAAAQGAVSDGLLALQMLLKQARESSAKNANNNISNEAPKVQQQQQQQAPLQMPLMQQPQQQQMPLNKDFGSSMTSLPFFQNMMPLMQQQPQQTPVQSSNWNNLMMGALSGIPQQQQQQQQPQMHMQMPEQVNMMNFVNSLPSFAFQQQQQQQPQQTFSNDNTLMQLAQLLQQQQQQQQQQSMFTGAPMISQMAQIVPAPAPLMATTSSGSNNDSLASKIALPSRRVRQKASNYSKFRGVFRQKGTKPWAVRVTLNNDMVKEIGQFSSEVEAALAFDRACIAHGLDRSLLNFPESVALEDQKDGSASVDSGSEPGSPDANSDASSVKLKRNMPSSNYRGVCWNKCNKSWKASIKVNGKNTHIGYFDNMHEAALAYDLKAIEVRGSRAILNFQHPKHPGF